jgi:hypothetical protein
MINLRLMVTHQHQCRYQLVDVIEIEILCLDLSLSKQLMMIKEFKQSFVSGCNKDREDGEKEYDDTVLQMLHQLPIMKKRKQKNDDEEKTDADDLSGYS